MAIAHIRTKNKHENIRNDKNKYIFTYPMLNGNKSENYPSQIFWIIESIS